MLSFLGELHAELPAGWTILITCTRREQAHLNLDLFRLGAYVYHRQHEELHWWLHLRIIIVASGRCGEPNVTLNYMPAFNRMLRAEYRFRLPVLHVTRQNFNKFHFPSHLLRIV